jgi:hypothetical protein
MQSLNWDRSDFVFLKRNTHQYKLKKKKKVLLNNNSMLQIILDCHDQKLKWGRRGTGHLLNGLTLGRNTFGNYSSTEIKQ